jgi:hypothetical protein
MSRLAVLRKNPKRTLSALIVALTAIGVAVGSGASFSSTSTATAGVFTAGTLHHTTTNGGVLATATIDDIKPGFGTSDGSAVDATSSSAGYGTMTVSNDGSLDGTFTIKTNETSHAYSGSNPPAAEVCGGGQGQSGTCSALDGVLKVKIDKVTGTGDVEVYNGLVSGLASNHVLESAFTLAASATRQYKLYFYFPDSGGDQNAYQGADTTLSLAITEAQ